MQIVTRVDEHMPLPARVSTPPAEGPWYRAPASAAPLGLRQQSGMPAIDVRRMPRSVLST